MADSLEGLLLKTIHEKGYIPDSGEFASSVNQDHNVVVGLIKSLQSSEMVLATVSWEPAAGQSLRSSSL